jgi:hypothetical protein
MFSTVKFAFLNLQYVCWDIMLTSSGAKSSKLLRPEVVPYVTKWLIIVSILAELMQETMIVFLSQSVDVGGGVWGRIVKRC